MKRWRDRENGQIYQELGRSRFNGVFAENGDLCVVYAGTYNDRWQVCALGEIPDQPLACVLEGIAIFKANRKIYRGTLLWIGRNEVGALHVLPMHEIDDRIALLLAMEEAPDANHL